MEEQNFKTLFQPSYSPMFNCEETVWRIVKNEYRKRLYRLDKNLKDGQEHKDFVNKVLEDVTPRINTTVILRANKRFVDAHAALDGNGPEQ